MLAALRPTDPQELDEPVGGTSARQLNSEVKKLRWNLRLDPLGEVVAYQVRHTGASHDRATGHRTQEDVTKRGALGHRD